MRSQGGRRDGARWDDRWRHLRRLRTLVAISGTVAWLAGFVALCAGYSYIQLDDLIDERGGAPTYIQSPVGNRTLVGVTGWTLLFEDVGSIALYAYAFSRFFAELFGRLHVFSIPVANAVSVVLISVFVGLNLVSVLADGPPEVSADGEVYTDSLRDAPTFHDGSGRVLVPAFTLDNSFGVRARVRSFEPHPPAGDNPTTLALDGTPSLRQ